MTRPRLIADVTSTQGAVSSNEIPSELVNFIAAEEGYRSKPYKDATVWAIGYGRTIPGSSSLKPTPIVTTNELSERKWMIDRLRSDMQAITTSKPSLTSQQKTYLTAVSYNIGLGAVLRNIPATGLAVRNFELTSKMRLFNKSGRPLTINPVLQARREREITQFLQG